MKKQDIRPNVVYRNKNTGHLGVLYEEYDYGCLSDDEVGMVYRGNDDEPSANNSFFVGTDPNNLEKYNLKPEDELTKSHIENICKIGQGESCCCYLVMDIGKVGIFSCARVNGRISIANHIRDRVKENDIGAKAINCGGRYNSVKSENLR